MNLNEHQIAHPRAPFLMLTALLFLLSACGTAQHSVKMEDTYALEPSMLIQVGQVTNQTGHNFGVDAEQLLTNALIEELRSRNLFWSGGEGRRLVLVSSIVEYNEGNAFKRWMLPGWGSTVLTVRGDLKDGERLVGSVDAHRTVSAGGGYTIGAWKSIFGDVAKDIVGDLGTKIQK